MQVRQNHRRDKVVFIVRCGWIKTSMYIFLVLLGLQLLLLQLSSKVLHVIDLGYAFGTSVLIHDSMEIICNSRCLLTAFFSKSSARDKMICVIWSWNCCFWLLLAAEVLLSAALVVLRRVMAVTAPKDTILLAGDLWTEAAWVNNILNPIAFIFNAEGTVKQFVLFWFSIELWSSIGLIVIGSYKVSSPDALLGYGSIRWTAIDEWASLSKRLIQTLFCWVLLVGALLGLVAPIRDFAAALWLSLDPSRLRLACFLLFCAIQRREYTFRQHTDLKENTVTLAFLTLSLSRLNSLGLCLVILNLLKAQYPKNK